MALPGLAFALPMIRRSGLGWLCEAIRDVTLAHPRYQPASEPPEGTPRR